MITLPTVVFVNDSVLFSQCDWSLFDISWRASSCPSLFPFLLNDRQLLLRWFSGIFLTTFVGKFRWSTSYDCLVSLVENTIGMLRYRVDCVISRPKCVFITNLLVCALIPRFSLGISLVGVIVGVRRVIFVGVSGRSKSGSTRGMSSFHDGRGGRRKKG